MIVAASPRYKREICHDHEMGLLRQDQPASPLMRALAAERALGMSSAARPAGLGATPGATAGAAAGVWQAGASAARENGSRLAAGRGRVNPFYLELHGLEIIEIIEDLLGGATADINRCGSFHCRTSLASPSRDG
jgi:hypothetical protein